MADYHILDFDAGKSTYRIAFHFAVPNKNNRAGVNYRVAVAQSEYHTPTSIIPWDIGQETQYLADGWGIELVEDFHVPPNNTQPQNRALIETRFKTLQVEVLSEIGTALEYWGYNGNVP